MRPTLSPRDLARAIGVSESSIKRWVDDGVIRASRTVGGHRRIAAAEALRFVRRSHSILVEPEILGLRELAALDGRFPRYGEEADALFMFLRDGRAEEARGLVMSLYLAGRSLAQIVDGPLRIAMERVGELWTDERSGIFVEHRATDIAMQLVSWIRAALAPPPGGAVAVGGAPSTDPYVLPTLCVAAVLEGEGMCAVNLGPDTPLEALGLAVESLGASLAWLSVTEIDDADGLRRDFRRLSARLEAAGVPLIVGGRQASRLEPRPNRLVSVGSSMVELETLVRGMRLSPPAAAASGS